MYDRYRFHFLLTFLVALPFVLYGAKCAWESTSNRPIDWLPESFEEREKLFWFGSRFGSDEILMISWPGCTFEDERQQLLADELLKPAPRKRAGPAVLFRRVFTGTQVLKKFTDPPLELTRRQALRRLEGWLLGKDHETTCVVALVSSAGIEDRHAAVDWVYESADAVDGLSRDVIHVAGSTVDGVAIDRITKESLFTLTSLSILIGFLVAYRCFRSLQLALMILVSSMFAQQLSMAIVYYSGTPMDSVMLMMASLVFILGVSSAVHFINYYADAIREHGLDGAPPRAARYALVPCGLAAATTALGLGSLAISKIVPISRFGVFSAIGVLAGFAVLFLLLPSGLEQWPAQRWASRLPDVEPRRQRSRRWKWLVGLVTRYHAVIVVATIVMFIAGGFGATRIRTTVRLRDLFTQRVRVIRDYNWLEAHVGPLVPVEVVLRFPAGDDEPMLERMRVVRHVQTALEAMDEVGATISAATFAPEFPLRTRQGVASTARRVILERKLQRHRAEFAALQYLNDTPSEELWRISARVPAGRDVDYGKLLERLRSQVTPVLAQLAAEGSAPVEAEYVGGVPLVHKAQEQLMRDLIKSFLVAFALIGLAMMLLLRGVRPGALLMLPNLLPSVVIFGGMGWTGYEIGIGSMMTASVALGIAVDDTLHFITWFHRGLASRYDRKQAVFFAYTRCGTAMVQTSLICGLGLLVFSVSPFVPTAQFAWLMAALLAAALLGDLVLLPAILIGPLGRTFQPKGAPGWRGGRSTPGVTGPP